MVGCNYIRLPTPPKYAHKSFAMMRSLLLLVVSALWSCSEGLPEDALVTVSAVLIVEQYCFPRSGGPFSASIWPSVTMMYSGITLTTTPLSFAVSDAASTRAPKLPVISCKLVGGGSIDDVDCVVLLSINVSQMRGIYME
jgi:hypothetical protein